MMQRIVVAAKAGAAQPWLADAAAQLANETGATVDVVSVDGLELEALSTLPRSELAALAREAADRMVAQLAERGVSATGEVRPGRVARGILLFAEEREADMIVCGASSRGPVASRMLGSVPLELVQRSRRPVLVITPPHEGEAADGRDA
jgi:nucleotide-binding universal stress UspA family protein